MTVSLGSTRLKGAMVAGQRWDACNLLVSQPKICGLFQVGVSCR